LEGKEFSFKNDLFPSFTITVALIGIVFVYDTTIDSLYGNIPRQVEAFTELKPTFLLGNKNDPQQDRQAELKKATLRKKHNIDLFLDE
jgi:hypothetical protein